MIKDRASAVPSAPASAPLSYQAYRPGNGQPSGTQQLHTHPRQHIAEPPLIALTPEPPPVPTGAPPNVDLHEVTTVDHQGTVIAFARAVAGTDLYYNVLDLKVSTAVDNQEWTGFTKLSFPDQIRPAGLGIVTIDDPGGKILAPAADAPIKLVSDEKYVHVFQQSCRNTLLMNRFMLKRVAPPGGGTAVPILEPIWEVRFQRSGKQDVPESDRDSQTYTAPDDAPFIEPTIELAMIHDLHGGQFDVVLLPSQSSAVRRWQFFAVNATTGKLDLFSFPSDENRLFDLTVDDKGNVAPDASVSLALSGGTAAAVVPLAAAGIPSATLYTLRERVPVSSGSEVMLKRSARVMLVQPVRQPDGPIEFATLDFGLAKDGKLAKAPAEIVATPVAPANYALQFSESAYLHLRNNEGSLNLRGSFAADFWLYPTSEITDDQFIFSGDRDQVPASEAAPYVKITRDLHVEVGFGADGKAFAAQTAAPVVAPFRWTHVQVAYDREKAEGNIEIRINRHIVPVSNGDVRAALSGKPITTVSGRDKGIIGILEALILTGSSDTGPQTVGRWPFDEINYTAKPPFTPDKSGFGNHAEVHGAMLVPSTAPSDPEEQGALYFDADGLSIYAGVLDFACPAGSGYLTTGSDGLLHLYFEGQPDDGHQAGPFCVAQYDAASARAVFEATWTSTVNSEGQVSKEIGALQFTAARSGAYMNQAAITVRPSSVDAGELCDVGIDDGHGRRETWQGVPRALDRFTAVLNGMSTPDVSDPAFRAGTRTFYDNNGRFAMSRLRVTPHGADTGLIALSRYPGVLQMDSASVSDVTDSTCSLTLTFVTRRRENRFTITQKWSGLPTAVAALLPVLAGISPSYAYGKTDSADARIYGLTAHDGPGTAHDVLLVARPGVTVSSVVIEPGTKPSLCKVSIDLDVNGTREPFELADVEREQRAFADALRAHPIGRYLLVITDDLTAALGDATFEHPADEIECGMHAWSAIVVVFPDEQLAPGARLPAQGPVRAAIMQGSTLTVSQETPAPAGNRTGEPLLGPSTMFRCAPASQPSNGGVALVDDTTGANGTAKLVTAAANGGWIRVSPHYAIELDGPQAVTWPQDAVAADVLAIAGDMTTEAWIGPGIIDSGRQYRRVATFNRSGNRDFPDEQVQWGLGLQPAASLNFNDNTEIHGSYNLTGTDCTLQIWVNPRQQDDRGQILQLGTTGTPEPYLTLMVDADQRVRAVYHTGELAVPSNKPIQPGTWVQLTATLAESTNNDGMVCLRLYVDGKVQGEAEGPQVLRNEVPGALTAGSVRMGRDMPAFPMQANGVFMWARALDAEEVARTKVNAPEPSDAGLVIAWYLTDGGPAEKVQNVAVEGYPFVSDIQNIPTPAWAETGIYRVPWAISRDYGVAATRAPLLGGWHHLAAAYRTAYALRLTGGDYADCGNDASLDPGSTLSIEAWFTPEKVDVTQTLVSKPGTYELGLNYDNTVLLTIATTSSEHPTIEVKSTNPVVLDQPYHVAATVECGMTTEKKLAGPGQQADNSPTYYLIARLYVNGVRAGEPRPIESADPVAIATSTNRLNLGRSSAGAAYFTGLLADVRLWNKVLSPAAIAESYRSHRLVSTDGLVSSWRWREARGKFAYDEHNLNNAVLSSNKLWALYGAAAALTLIVDGAEQTDVLLIDPAAVGGYGARQFTVAANRIDDTTLADYFAGEVSEVRIWQGERTAEQIREHMYGQLTGAETGLAGYWPCNAGSGLVVEDATGHGNAGELFPPADPPVWVASRAPVSSEAKEVYNILGGLATDHIARISGMPSMVEYPDTRRDAYGAPYSVMKRCYAADTTRALDLITGFAVGDLDTIYAGQVQFAPSLVGFIEGAPPIPSENQTNPWWHHINFRNTYADTARVRLTQAQKTTRAFSGSERTGDSISLDGKAGLYISASGSMGVAYGAPVAYSTDWDVVDIEGHIGYAGQTDAGSDSESDLGFGYGKTTTVTDEITARGEWEPTEMLNDSVGRRFVPYNMGYAVVKSLTADLYLVTLKGTNSVVKMELVPDPDIPEDVNVIGFPIDPGYTKNGTLDGMVGFKADPDFPNADVQRSSYFRPLEAYIIKRAVERQDQQLEAYYQQFDTANLSQGIRLGPNSDAASAGNGFSTFKAQVVPGDPSFDWQRGLAKRSIVNTYAWSAAGGLHTEQSELTDTYTESYTGMSNWSMTNGLAADLAAAFIVGGLYGEFDALFSSSVEVASIRAKDCESGFGLDVAFTVERYLKCPTLRDGQPTGYGEQDAPGKVTGFRFMSFFVPPSEANFGLFGQIIDRNWLENSAGPDATALRTATAETNGAWRVLHRVTYVSRVAPPLQPTSADTTAPPITPPVNLASNRVVTKLVQVEIGQRSPSPTVIGAAVTAVLGTSHQQPGRLAEVLPWWPTLLKIAADDPRGDASRELADLRTDLLSYMVRIYAAEAAQPGSIRIAELYSR